MVWYKRYEPSQILYGVISWVKSNTFKSGVTDNATPYIALTAPSTKPKSVCNTKCLFIFIPPLYIFNRSEKLKNHALTVLNTIRTWLNTRYHLILLFAHTNSLQKYSASNR